MKVTKPRHLARAVAKANMKRSGVRKPMRNGWFAQNWETWASMQIIDNRRRQTS